MARVRISMPSNYIFSCKMMIRITDVNYGNHLGNDAVLGMIHEARMRFMKDLGYTELNLAGAAIIMADVAIVYRSEGHYGDSITTEINVGDISRAGFDIYYRMYNHTTQKLLAEAKTGIVCYDYDQGKILEVPHIFIKIINQKNGA